MFDWFLSGLIAINGVLDRRPVNATKTTPKPKMSQVNGDSVTEVSSGFHFVEIHLPTMGKGLLIVGALILAAVLFRWWLRSRKTAPAAPAPAQVFAPALPAPVPNLWSPRDVPHLRDRIEDNFARVLAARYIPQPMGLPDSPHVTFERYLQAWNAQQPSRFEELPSGRDQAPARRAEAAPQPRATPSGAEDMPHP